MEDFFVTITVETTFDSLDHKFLISVLKKIGFGQNFISWIEIIVKIKNHVSLTAEQPQNILN